MQAKVPMSKILQENFPKGLVLPRKYLLAKGVQAYTLDNNVRNGKFRLAAKGIYSWSESSVSVEGFLASLPYLMQQKIWLGAESALRWQGFVHNVSFSNLQRVSLLSESHIPANIKAVASQIKGLEADWCSGSRLWDYSTLQACSSNGMTTQIERKGFRIELSTPEMAVLELLHQVPDKVSFEMADHIIQSLTQLSPRKMTKCLIACKSVKAKRLFFWFTQRYQYPYSQHLQSNDFDLGSGKRRVAKDGVLDKDLLITVPKEMQEGTQ